MSTLGDTQTVCSAQQAPCVCDDPTWDDPEDSSIPRRPPPQATESENPLAPISKPLWLKSWREARRLEFSKPSLLSLIELFLLFQLTTHLLTREEIKPLASVSLCAVSND